MNTQRIKRSRCLSVIVLFTVILIGAIFVLSGPAAATQAGPQTGAGLPVNVTAGATNQQAFDSNGAATFNFSEVGDVDSQFTSSGDVLLSIPRQSSIRFDTSNTTLGLDVTGNKTKFVAGGTNATIDDSSFDSNRQLRVDVSGLESDNNENITISGVRFDVPADASNTQLTFNFGAETESFPLGTERLSAEINASADVPLGADQTDAVNISIEGFDPRTGVQPGGQGDVSLNTSGLHASGQNITVSIPSSNQNQISFDTSQTPQFANGAGKSTISDANVGDAEFTSPNSFTFSVSTNVDNSADIEFGRIGFNTSGSNTGVNVTTELNVTAVPVDATSSVERQTLTRASANETTAVAPSARIANGSDRSEFTFAPGENGAIGDSSLSSQSDVGIDDDSGSTGDNANGALYINTTVDDQIATNADVQISIPAGSGVTFDQRQNIEVEAVDGDNGTASNLDSGPNVQLTDRQITVPVNATSDKNDGFLIGTPFGAPRDATVSPIRFNITPASSVTNLNLTVTTGGGAATVTQNTSQNPQDNTQTSDIDVNAPNILTNGNSNQLNSAQSSDLTIETDGDGENQRDPSNANANTKDIVLSSGATGDIASDTQGTNISLTLGASSGITFDQSAPINVSSRDGLTNETSDTISIVDDRTINLTIGQSDNAVQNDDIDIEGIRYNVTSNTDLSTQITATINRSGVSITASENINVSTVRADQIQTNASAGSNFGDSGSSAAATTVQAGNAQATRIAVNNSTSFGNVPLTQFGGATFSLAVTDTPADVSAGDVQLNTTTATTNQNGKAAYNVTDFGGVSGDYNVTATLNSNTSVNVTTTYTVAPSNNVDTVSVSPIEDSIATQSGDIGNATLFVNVTDAFGNTVTGQNVDISVTTDDVNTDDISVYNDLTANGDVSGSSADSLQDGSFTVDSSDGSSVIVVSTSTAGDVTITAETQGNSDSGTVTVFEQIDQTSLSVNATTTPKNTVVAANTTIQESDGTSITVPDVTVNYDDNGNANTSFPDGSADSDSATTNNNGVASVLVSADQNGTSTIDATTNLRSDSVTVNIEPTAGQEEPPTADVTFNDQGVTNGATSVNVESARFDGTEDFVIVVHRATPGNNGVVDGTDEIGAKIGSSDVLTSNNVSDVSVDLTKSLDEGGNTQLTEDQTLVAMLHFANESRPGDRNFDTSIKRDGSPVFDQAEITVSPLEGAAGEFDDDGNGNISLPELSEAARAFTGGELTLSELTDVATAFTS